MCKTLFDIQISDNNHFHSRDSLVCFSLKFENLSFSYLKNEKSSISTNEVGSSNSINEVYNMDCCWWDVTRDSNCNDCRNVLAKGPVSSFKW